MDPAIMDREVQLTGLLIPVDWHGSGRVKAVALATADEEEIVIAGPLPNDILRHLRQLVHVWGVFENPVQRRRFYVHRCRSAAGVSPSPP